MFFLKCGSEHVGVVPVWKKWSTEINGQLYSHPLMVPYCAKFTVPKFSTNKQNSLPVNE